MTTSSATALTAQDYASNQDIRWCPGCGDYAILKAVRQTLADIRADPSQTVFISGIGCAARFPYYMETYGFHTIHGRAAAIATGVKIANPELDIWIVSGDGDSLSIGGNHLAHLLRRNVDLVYLLFNNEIYGLTKGQASPTSRRGTRSPSSPQGSLTEPIHTAKIALGSGAGFIARSIDVSQKHLMDVLKRAHAHKGTSLVEILQNCIIFNDGIHDALTNKKTRKDHVLELNHGEPMIWGANNDKGFIFNPETLSLQAVTIGHDGVNEADILRHDETNPTLAWMLAGIDQIKDMPTPLGVLYAREDQAVFDMKRDSPTSSPDEIRQRLKTLLNEGQSWEGHTG